MRAVTGEHSGDAPLGIATVGKPLVSWLRVCDEVELDYAASVYNLSGWWYDDDDYLKGGDVLINDTRGYAAIVDAVRASWQGQVRVLLGVAASNVTYSQTGVSVQTDTHGLLEADYVVVASSLGTLKRGLLKFSPALPTRLDKAIKRLGCDVSDKVVSVFPPGSEASRHQISRRTHRRAWHPPPGSTRLAAAPGSGG